jgi:hypothetical protein
MIANKKGRLPAAPFFVVESSCESGIQFLFLILRDTASAASVPGARLWWLVEFLRSNTCSIPTRGEMLFAVAHAVRCERHGANADFPSSMFRC